MLHALPVVTASPRRAGVTVTLFQNIHHQRELYRMGLRPSTAFGCIYNYLLFPKPETLAVLDKELQEVLAADVLIGVQVRGVRMGGYSKDVAPVSEWWGRETI